jgi:predicted TIM-barrel fold metal-dependent hydrolase
MAVIDSDTHVDETEETWEYMNESERRFKPVTVMQQVQLAEGQVPGYDRFWLVDGALRVRRIRNDTRTGTTQETRELLDIPARLRHMDQLGVDTQVIYPTFFLSRVTDRPEAEVALCRSYNRWLASKCAQSGGRLQWVAVLPLLNIEASVEEVRWAKESGACGVMKKGVECGGRAAGDPYFYPIYAAASSNDIAVCIHSGSGEMEQNDLRHDHASMWSRGLPVIDALCSMVTKGVPDRFPGLRVGFIEAGSSWIPFALDVLWARQVRQAWHVSFDLKTDLLRQSRFYVACQTQEDLPYLLEHGAEDSLVIGTDYSHADGSAEIEALTLIREKGDKGEIPQVASRKIVEDNPRSLYGL